MTAAQVILVGCADSVRTLVPEGTESLSCPDWREAIGRATSDAVILLGDRVQSLPFAAQAIGRRLERGQMVVCVPAASVAHARQVLMTTPFVPIDLRVVPDDDAAAISEAIHSASLRIRLSHTHGRIAAQLAGSRSDPKNDDVAEAATNTRDLDLHAFFRFYDAHRDAIGDALLRHVRGDATLGPLLASQSPEEREARERHSAALQRAAFIDGEWGPYIEDLCAQGQAYAALGLPFGAWYRLLPVLREAVLRIAASDPIAQVDLRGLMLGLGHFTDVGMEATARGYLDASAALQREADRRARLFSAIVESSHDPIVSESLGGVITGWNRAAEERFGYTAERAVGSSVALLIPEEALVLHREARERLRNAEVVPGFETVRRTRDGKLVDVLATLSPITDSGGVVQGVSSILRDITARKRAEREREQLVENLRRSNDDLEHFAYVASHDLQEPLRMVIGFLSLLEGAYGSQLDAKASGYVRNATDGARRMKVLINDLLAYARVDSRGTDPVSCSLQKILDEVLEDLATPIAESRATMTAGPLPRVLADRTQIGLVLRNLLSNAIKFRADRPLEVTISAEARSDGWEVAVADNGIGFDAGFQDRVFRMFQRLHDRSTYPGSGIGLAIVKRIVERHGGRIWAESSPGVGSCFRFTLPRAGAEGRADEREDRQ